MHTLRPTLNEENKRTHVVLPEDLVKEVDALVGPRRRSLFFTEAVREKVKRTKLKAAASKAVGSLSDISIPDWETSEKAATWVHASRRFDEAKRTPTHEGA